MRYLNCWDNKNFWGAQTGPLTHASAVKFTSRRIWKKFFHCMCINIWYGKEWRFLFLKLSFYLANWENQNITYILNFPVQFIAELPHSQYKRVVIPKNVSIDWSLPNSYTYPDFYSLCIFPILKYNQIIFFLEIFFLRRFTIVHLIFSKAFNLIGSRVSI